jgi:hypothetical protein
MTKLTECWNLIGIMGLDCSHILAEKLIQVVAHSHFWASAHKQQVTTGLFLCPAKLQEFFCKYGMRQMRRMPLLLSGGKPIMHKCALQLCSLQMALYKTYCDEIPESRNSGIGSEVDFLGKELLRQLHDNR